MREIEYRGQALRSKLWVRGYYWTNENGNHFIRQAVDLNGCFRIADIEVDPETVGQYTGLKDRNGIKIYEGDIVKIKNDVANMFEVKNIGIIKYIGGMFLVSYNEENRVLQSLYVLGDTNYNLRGEVIGNIVDNKELLEE